MALTATLLADFSSFIDATKEAGAAMSGFQKQAETVGPAADKSFTLTQEQAVKAAKAVNQVVTTIVSSAQPFIKAFTEEQDAVNRLTTALQATGNATPAVIKSYQDMAGEFQKTTRFADEAVVDITATLTTIGKVGPEQMKLALTATTNLASSLKIDLEQAAQIVAKSLSNLANEKGPVRKLQDVLKEAYKPGMSAAEMLQAINTKTGNAAQNDLKTYNGQVENMANQMGELDETIGKLVTERMAPLMQTFQELPDWMQTVIAAVVKLGGVIASLAGPLSAVVTVIGATGLGAALGASTVVLTAFGVAIVGTVGLAILYWNKAGDQAKQLYVIIRDSFGKIPALAQQVYEGIKLWIVDRFTTLLGSVRLIGEQLVAIFRWMWAQIVGGSIVPDLITGIAKEFGQLDRVMVDPARKAAAHASQAFAGIGAGTAGGFGGLVPSGAGGTAITINMTGMLGTNDPQTRQAITQVVGDALAHSMRGQRLLSSA